MVPAHVVFYAASATMPRYVLVHVKELLQMRANTREIRLSNDRPNIHLATLEMLNPLNSCHDLVCVCYVTAGTFARRGLSLTAKTLRSLSGVRGSEY